MNNLVSIQRRDAGVGATGQPVDSWSEIATEWASIEPASGREYFATSGERSDVTHEIRLRVGGPAFAPADRVVCGSRVFDVQSVLNDYEANRFLVLMVVERIG